MDRFLDRTEAGKVLAALLKDYEGRPEVIVLALPRGGVPIGYEIASAIKAPLDVFIVRKLGAPEHPELAIGAIASADTIVYNDSIIRDLRITPEAIQQVLRSEKAELQRRESVYRENRPFPELKGKTIILVDDGIATGATMRVAIKALRVHQPKKIIVAVPVASDSVCTAFSAIADEIVCPLQPHFFNAVGAWYVNFPQTSDEEVFSLLHESKH